jgi:hypothetical protein
MGYSERMDFSQRRELVTWHFRMSLVASSTMNVLKKEDAAL